MATVIVDGAELRWSPNTGALRALSDARVREGDTIRVHRFEDTKRGARTYSNWAIEKIEPAAHGGQCRDGRARAGRQQKEGADGEPPPF